MLKSNKDMQRFMFCFNIMNTTLGFKGNQEHKNDIEHTSIIWQTTKCQRVCFIFKLQSIVKGK